MTVSLKGTDCAIWLHPLCNPCTHIVPCVRRQTSVKTTFSPSCLHGQDHSETHRLWKCRPGSTSGFLAEPGEAGLPTYCMCLVQQTVLIFCTCARESRSYRSTCCSAHLLKSLAPQCLFWSHLVQLMLGLSSLPQVSRFYLQMWVSWQLFLTASVTRDNATSVKWLPSAGRLHCQL